MGKPFKLWPDPKDGEPYGPQPKQRSLFIELLEEDERPHWHPQDIVLFIGAARSGKTVSAVARTIQYLIDNPGSLAIVGAENYPLLQRTALKEWTDRFTDITPWDHLKRSDSIIIKKPTQNDKSVIFRNGSKAVFLHFTDPKVLRGMNASIIHYEEACLLPDSEAFNELKLRLSGSTGEVRQLILTTNPPDDEDWIVETFALRDDLTEEERETALPHCNCQYCQDCLNAGLGEFIYTDKYGMPSTKRGAECSNPNCQKMLITLAREGIARKSIKEHNCPGNQEFYRVIQTQTVDNPHLPAEFVQSLTLSMSKTKVEQFLEGKYSGRKDGYVYPVMSNTNLNSYNKDLDYSKHLIWSLDFNIDPECSVLWQESEVDGETEIDVIDEIVLPNALAEHVGQHFVQKYEQFKYSGNFVLIYGDPAALYGTGVNLEPTKYQKIYNILKNEGFSVKIIMKRPDKDAIIKEPLLIPLYPSTDNLNDWLMFKNQYGQPRLRINPKCKWLIKSLKETKKKTKENGKWDIDKKCDKAYCKRDDKITVSLLTHPSDALRYGIYKRFPPIEGKKTPIIIQDMDGNSTTISNHKVETRQISRKIDENYQKFREQKRLEREQRKRARAEKKMKEDNNLYNIIEILKQDDQNFYF